MDRHIQPARHFSPTQFVAVLKEGRRGRGSEGGGEGGKGREGSK